MALATEQSTAIQLTYSQGCVMIKGSTIDAIARESIQNNEIKDIFLTNRTDRDGDHFHLTVLSKKDVDSLTDKSNDALLSKARKDLKLTAKSSSKSLNGPHLLCLGVGKANAKNSTAYFSVILWPELLKFRRGLKLSNERYHPHITLGFNRNDVHGVNKSISSLLPATTNNIDCQCTLQILHRFPSKYHAQIILDALDIVLSVLSDDKSKRNLLCRVLSFRMNLFGSKSRFSDCLKDSLEILKLDPFHCPALISQAICMLSMKPSRPLEAAETFRFAQKVLDLYLGAKGSVNEEIAAKQLLSFFGDDTECLSSAAKAVTLQSVMEQTKSQCAVWSDRIRKGLKQCRRETLSVALSTRIRISVQYPATSPTPDGAVPEKMQWHNTVLPRNFSWIVDGWLCGVSIPKSAEQLKAFEAMNIGLILSFFEDPIPAETQRLIDGHNLQCVHIHTLNYKVPKLFDMERAVKAAEECVFVRNKAVLMHCGGGKGRAGTGLACFVLKWGLVFEEKWRSELESQSVPKWKQPQKGAAEVINHIKMVRPGSIETVEQEQFIKAFSNHLWSKVKADDPSTTKEEEEEEKKGVDSDPTGLKEYPALSPQQTKCIKSKQYPELIVLCGIPGSGKSMFCRMLNTVNRQQRDHAKTTKMVTEWRFANQDELGKRGDVECVVKQWLNDKKSTKMGMVIDRCNVTRSERKEWLEFAFRPKRAVVVHFDIDPDVCSSRVFKRKDHPTISDRSSTAIDRLCRSFAKKMEAPLKKEGFAAVYTVRSTADLLTVCGELGCLPEVVRHFVPTPFFKFPRTPHLWNTGAATRDDIRLDPKLQAMYFGPSAKTVCVTEKVDGANLGISLSENWEIECQHRGQRIVHTTSSEYSKLKEWLERKGKFLSEVLSPKKDILFGEWCQAQHSIGYDNLPDYFLVFDCYDRGTRRFMSRRKLEALCRGRFSMTKCIGHRRFESKQQIEELMNGTMSSYKLKTPGPIEGLYLKIEDEEEGVNVHRCKLVRSEFIQGMDIGHWSRQQTVHNTVRQRYDEYDDEDGDDAVTKGPGDGVGEEKKSGGDAGNDSRGDTTVNAVEDEKVKEKDGATKNAGKRGRKNRNRKVANQRDDKLYFAPMARSRFAMNLKVLCRKLELDADSVLNVYVVGSRVWGTASSKSDWDVIVVVESKKKMKRKGVTAAVDNIDAVVWDKEEWAAEMCAHRFNCLLTLFLPQSAIWKEELSVSAVSGLGGISLRLFAEKVVDTVGRDCKKLNKFYGKGKMDKVHRTFVHSLRMIESAKRVIDLLKEDVKCTAFANDAFVGVIKFDEIDAAVRRKKEEMAGAEEQSADLWVSCLESEGKVLLSQLS